MLELQQSQEAYSKSINQVQSMKIYNKLFVAQQKNGLKNPVQITIVWIGIYARRRNQQESYSYLSLAVNRPQCFVS